MNKKVIAAAVSLSVSFAVWAVLWKSTFSIISANDKWFVIAYIIIFIILALIFFKSKKPFMQYILSGILCIFTLTSLLIYRGWNSNGYHINVNEVACIEYCTLKNNTTDTILFDSDDADAIEGIIESYNSSECVKRWDDGARIGTPEEYIRIVFKDGRKATIEEDGCVSIAGKEYKAAFTLDNLTK